MHAALNDVHKRTSISQLLNPLANSGSRTEPPISPSRLPALVSAGPSSPSQDGTSQNEQLLDASNPGSSFQLRSASWDPLRQTLKRPDGPEANRPYHFHSFTEGFAADPRAARPRDGTGNSNGSSGVWPAPHEMPNMGYGTPVLAPLYSDERTGELSNSLDVQDANIACTSLVR